MGKGDTYQRNYHSGSGIVLAIAGGITTGYIVCPLLNYLMGIIPVPYGWITNQPEHLRLTLFLTGAFGLFFVTSLLTIGTCAAILGYLYKNQVTMTATLVFISSAITYCCFILDTNIFTRFTTWLARPMAWFYISEIVALFLLCLSMSWFGSTLRWIREYCQDNAGHVTDVPQ